MDLKNKEGLKIGIINTVAKWQNIYLEDSEQFEYAVAVWNQQR